MKSNIYQSRCFVVYNTQGTKKFYKRFDENFNPSHEDYKLVNIRFKTRGKI